jgi:hypothetical protein
MLAKLAQLIWPRARALTESVTTHLENQIEPRPSRVGVHVDLLSGWDSEGSVEQPNSLLLRTRLVQESLLNLPYFV